MPPPNIFSPEKARKAAWIIVLGGVAGLVFLPAGWDGLHLVLGTILLLDGIALIVLRSWMRGRVDAVPAPKPERSLGFVAVAALAWGMIDAFVAGQCVISFVLCVVGALHFLPRALAARQDAQRFKLRMSKAAITVFAGLAAIGIIVWGNALAGERAEKLIAAVEQFHAAQGRYPARLEELVPAHLPEIPRARYLLLAERFRYYAADSGHTLMYVVVPPFGRRIYTFETGKWSSLD
jgi:hypothetical protein